MSIESVVKYWQHEHWQEWNIEYFRDSAIEASRWWLWTILFGAFVSLCVCAQLVWWDTLPTTEQNMEILFAVTALFACVLATLWWMVMLSLWLSAVCGRKLLTRVSAL